MTEPTTMDYERVLEFNRTVADYSNDGLARLVADARAEERSKHEALLAEALKLSAAEPKLLIAIDDLRERGGLAACEPAVEVFVDRAKTLLAEVDPVRAVSTELCDWHSQCFSVHGWVVRWRRATEKYFARAESAEAKLAEMTTDRDALAEQVRHWRKLYESQDVDIEMQVGHRTMAENKARRDAEAKLSELVCELREVDERCKP